MTEPTLEELRSVLSERERKELDGLTEFVQLYKDHPELRELLPRHEGEVGSWTAQVGHAQALLDSLIQVARIRWEKRPPTSE
jgi:hypothetical protein